jgi:hypothetical protein
MQKQTVKEEVQVTPAQEKLLEFFESKEIPDLIQCLKRVFETACFFSQKEQQNYDITALYFQYELIEMLYEMKDMLEDEDQI